MANSLGRSAVTATLLVALSAPAAATTSTVASGTRSGDSAVAVGTQHGEASGAATAVRAAPTSTRPVRATRRVAQGNPKAFAFLSKHRRSDPIARWNPCKPIGYRVNAKLAGPGALNDVRTAVTRVRRASGLRFAYRGPTKLVPGSRGGNKYPKDTQLVIAWATPATSVHLRDFPVAGVGGARWIEWTERGRTKALITKGYVVANAETELEGGFGSGPDAGVLGTRGQLLMHEIGHAVGLAHPRQDDPWQIMYFMLTQKRAVWGAGDLNGLRGVGSRKGCLRFPAFGADATTRFAAVHN